MSKLTKNDAVKYGSEGVTAYNYPLPNIESGSSVVYAELTGEHGERTTGDRSRVYYILEGEGEFIVDREKVKVQSGDVVPLPPHTTYNYWPTSPMLKVLLFMELLDVSKLPKK